MEKAFQIHGITEKYREKSRNGDHILYREIEQEGIVLALVADGVSNSPCDWLASRTACDTFYKTFFEGSSDSIDDRMCSGAEEANRALLYHDEVQKMLCAFAAVGWNIGSDRFSFLNIGDTRIYHTHDLIVEQITEDDADIIFLKRDGKMATDSHGHPLSRRVITNAFGASDCKIEIEQKVWFPGDILVLSSDGFYNSYGIIEDIRSAVLEQQNVRQALSGIWIENMEMFEDDASVVVMKRAKRSVIP